MKKIYKYTLKTTDTQTLMLTKGYKILTIQIQRQNITKEVPCLWVLVDPEEKQEAVIIDIFGTGNPVPDLERDYIGTYQLSGELVFHVFERR